MQPYPILDSVEQPLPPESPVFSGTAALHILSYSTHSDTSTHMCMLTHSLTRHIYQYMAPFTSQLLSVCHLSSLPSVAVINTVAKNNLGIKGFISVHRVQSTIQGSPGRDSGQELMQKPQGSTADWPTLLVLLKHHLGIPGPPA